MLNVHAKPVTLQNPQRPLPVTFLAGKKFPHLLDHIQELREERERRYGVTVMGQLKRLYDLSAGAEEAGQFSAAINAEKIRSALGGLTVDRRENIHQLDDLSREEITSFEPTPARVSAGVH